MKMERLKEIMMFTFLGEKALETVKNITLWNPILNYVVDQLDHDDINGEVGY